MNSVKSQDTKSTYKVSCISIQGLSEKKIKTIPFMTATTTKINIFFLKKGRKKGKINQEFIKEVKDLYNGTTNTVKRN